MKFNLCYFKSFKALVVKSSKLDKINCTATTWPKVVSSYSKGGDKKKYHYFEIREACRQLKLAMADHQDRVSDLQFHSLKMNAYGKIVWKKWKDYRNVNDIGKLVENSHFHLMNG